MLLYLSLKSVFAHDLIQSVFDYHYYVAADKCDRRE